MLHKHADIRMFSTLPTEGEVLLGYILCKVGMTNLDDT